MRRRTDAGDAAAGPVVTAPLEMTDYRVWCESRGLAWTSEQWQAWMDEREEWAAAHGVDADDLPSANDVDAPWDWSNL